MAGEDFTDEMEVQRQESWLGILIEEFEKDYTFHKRGVSIQCEPALEMHVLCPGENELYYFDMSGYIS